MQFIAFDLSSNSGRGITYIETSVIPRSWQLRDCVSCFAFKVGRQESQSVHERR